MVLLLYFLDLNVEFVLLLDGVLTGLVVGNVHVTVPTHFLEEDALLLEHFAIDGEELRSFLW